MDRIRLALDPRKSDPRVAERLKQDLFEADFARSYEMNGPLSVDWVDVLADFVLEGL